MQLRKWIRNIAQLMEAAPSVRCMPSSSTPGSGTEPEDNSDYESEASFATAPAGTPKSTTPPPLGASPADVYARAIGAAHYSLPPFSAHAPPGARPPAPFLGGPQWGLPPPGVVAHAPAYLPYAPYAPPPGFVVVPPGGNISYPTGSAAASHPPAAALAAALAAAAPPPAAGEGSFEEHEQSAIQVGAPAFSRAPRPPRGHSPLPRFGGITPCLPHCSPPSPPPPGSLRARGQVKTAPSAHAMCPDSDPTLMPFVIVLLYVS